MRTNPACRARFFGFVALLGIASCQSAVDGAKETFSKEQLCPLDRVESRERSDLKASSFKVGRTPPKDIAADPARLKMWQDQEDARLTQSDGLGTITEVRGCDKQAFYRCTRSSKHASYVNCFTIKDETHAIATWK